MAGRNERKERARTKSLSTISSHILVITENRTANRKSAIMKEKRKGEKGRGGREGERVRARERKWYEGREWKERIKRENGKGQTNRDKVKN